MEIVSGIITRGVGGLYEVDTENEIIECKAKGVFRHDMIAPTVGDRVTVEKDKDSAVISKIEERKNLLIRPPLANLDIIFCVIPSKDPAPDLFTLDKLIAIAEKNSIEPVIIVTKSDLDNASADRIVSIYKKSGFSVFGVSTYDEESVDALRSFIKEHARGKISAFAGASGAGKSTLMNSLFPSLKIVTGTLSKKTSRGRHTTRAVDLYPFSRISPDMNDGYLADTHTAVAIHAAEEYVRESGDSRPMVIDSTASPYKFAGNVYRSLTGTDAENDLAALDQLSAYTKTEIPYPLAGIATRKINFDQTIDRDGMVDAVLAYLG
jgi:ribosome biogenesis GTPase